MEASREVGAEVQAYHPEAMDEAQRIYVCRDALILWRAKECELKNARALVIVTEWQAFCALNFRLIEQSLSRPVMFDGRNRYEPSRMVKKGITYCSVGRGQW